MYCNLIFKIIKRMLAMDAGYIEKKGDMNP